MTTPDPGVATNKALGSLEDNISVEEGVLTNRRQRDASLKHPLFNWL